MSTIAVNAITDANAGNTTTINGVTPNSANVVGKNRIIGGDFTTNPWQRGTSFAALALNTYFADRWLTNYITSAVVTASKAVDAPTAAQAGIFTQHCLSLAVTTADTSIAANDSFSIRQFIEGFNAASFGFGQAGSRNVTLSFWVKGTKTGIHCVGLRNSAGDRTYIAEYTIVTTNTWEYKTITIPVDTTGTWLYDNNVGLRVEFTLMSGTNFHTTANTWVAGNFRATANQVNALDSTANTFKIALVQLEAGSSATEFEHRPYGMELQLCQRYYQKVPLSFGAAIDPTLLVVCYQYPVVMRAVPTVALLTATPYAEVPFIAGYTASGAGVQSHTYVGSTDIKISGFSGLTTYRAPMMLDNNQASLSAEL